MRTCTKCSAKEEDVKFRKNRNVCVDCHSKYNAEYRAKNYERIRKQHKESYQQNKKKRQASVKKAVQKSPEAFLRYLMHHITKKSNYKKMKKGKYNPAALEVDITYEYLLEQYEKQNKLCSMTKLPMKHAHGSLSTISIDRNDSSKGYVQGNVQIVCQAINTAKRHHSNQDMFNFLDQYYHVRKEEEFLGKIKPILEKLAE